MNVSIGTYGNYASNNYGANTIRVGIGGVELYFSYKTLVAFSTNQTGLVVHVNDWASTTGKHLNWIDGGEKSRRLDHVAFQAKLDETLAAYDVVGIPTVAAGA